MRSIFVLSIRHNKTKTNKMNNFKSAVQKMTTQDLINLQEGMMMLKTNKTSMSQIDLLEDIINERVGSI